MIVQRTYEWYAARCGRVTASQVWRIMERTRSGQPTAERRSYMIELLTELDTGEVVSRPVTAAIAWGIETEAAALAAYEVATGEILEPGGWVDAGDFGATPDAFTTFSPGLVEAKCPISTTVTRLRYFDLDIPAAWRWQMIAQIAATGREWCDLAIYDPRMVHADALIVRRIYRADVEDDIAAMRAAVREFLAEMQEIRDGAGRGHRGGVVDLSDGGCGAGGRADESAPGDSDGRARDAGGAGSDGR